MAENTIYHVCKRDEWQAAQARGVYAGSTQDAKDGFIHFSPLSQVRASTAKHRSGQDELILLVVDTDVLGGALKWEPSRDDLLFPHLYADLSVDAVREAIEIRLGSDGVHIFPDGYPE